MVAELESKRAEVEALCRQFAVQVLYAFGSAVEGGFQGGRSDYDFLVRFFPGTPHEHSARYFGLLGSLEKLLDAQVDLVEIDAIENKRFKRSVEKKRVLMYGAWEDSIRAL